MTDSKNDRLEQGKRKRASVMGQGYVDRAFAGDPDAFGADFQRFMTEYAWGAVWGRGNLSDRERHMITLVILAALAVLMTAVNIFGGFLVTRRMLAMFQKS